MSPLQRIITLAFFTLVLSGYTTKGDGIEVLEPFIESGLGVALKSDQGKYIAITWRRINDKSYDEYVMESRKTVKDRLTKIFPEKVSGGYVKLKLEYKNKYICAFERYSSNWKQYIYPLGFASYPNLKEDCKFKVYKISNNQVAFYSEKWRRFLSRVYRYEPMWGNSDSRQNIEARYGGISNGAKFTVSTGSITPVREEIVSIKWGKFEGPSTVSPTLVSKRERRNGGSKAITDEFSFEKSIETTQQTNWEHAWGVTAGVSYTASASVNVGVVSGSSSLTLSAEVNYNGKKGGNMGKKKIIKVHEKTTVTIPPGKHCTIKFMVTVVENAKIPFEATIKRSSEKGVQYITQKGTWKGVMVVDSFISVEERALNDKPGVDQ